MIEIRNLSVHFQGETRIAYQDFAFEDGKSYVLLGASGSGKSTRLNVIAGVLTPASGEVMFDGRNMSAVSQKEKDRFRIEKIGYIFQDFKLMEEMTVEDNIRVLKLEHVDVSQMDAVLLSLGIFEYKRRKVKRLSGGEKQRVAIARALVKRPELILADEPTGSLNYAVGKEVIAQLLQVANGKTLIAVTHDDRLAGYFDCVLDMDKIACGEVLPRV